MHYAVELFFHPMSQELQRGAGLCMAAWELKPPIKPFRLEQM